MFYFSFENTLNDKFILHSVLVGSQGLEWLFPRHLKFVAYAPKCVCLICLVDTLQAAGRTTMCNSLNMELHVFVLLPGWEINECMNLGSDTSDLCFCFPAAPHLHLMKKTLCDTEIPFLVGLLFCSTGVLLRGKRAGATLSCALFERR